MTRRLAVTLAVLLALTGGPAAQPAGVTVDPVTAKGPTDAPVTIVEFSDYQ